LERFEGLEVGELDMGRGALPVRFGPGPHPTEAELRNAVERAGYTFLGLERR
jgi:hypothetical protein